MNGTRYLNGSVHIFFKGGLFGLTNVGFMFMRVAFECCFVNWIIFGHLVYS